MIETLREGWGRVRRPDSSFNKIGHGQNKELHNNRSGGFVSSRYVLFIFILLLLLASLTSSIEITEDYCTSETFKARCAYDDHVIFVRRATYGRLRASRCITSEYAHAMGCYSDVTSYIDARCSGRNSCSMLVATMDSIAQPCAKDFKSFLEVTYFCQKVSFFTDCRLHDNRTTLLTDKQGYLAVYTTTDRLLQYNAPSPSSAFHPSSPLPSSRSIYRGPCTWVISVDPGQRINITWRVVSAAGMGGLTGAEKVGNGEGEEKEEGENVAEQREGQRAWQREGQREERLGIIATNAKYDANLQHVEGEYDPALAQHRTEPKGAIEGVDPSGAMDEEGWGGLMFSPAGDEQNAGWNNNFKCPFSLKFLERRSGIGDSRGGGSGGGGKVEEGRVGGVEYVHRTCGTVRGVQEPAVIYRSVGNHLEIELSGSYFYSGGSLHGVAAAGQEPENQEKQEQEHEQDGEEKDELKPYILQYQVYGCSDTELPALAVTSRSGDDASIVCNDSLEIYYVTCVADRWVGEMGNCTKMAARSTGGDSSMIQYPDTQFRQGVVMAIAVGVLLGLIVGCLMLVFVLLLKRRRNRKKGLTLWKHHANRTFSEALRGSASRNMRNDTRPSHSGSSHSGPSHSGPSQSSHASADDYKAFLVRDLSSWPGPHNPQCLECARSQQWPTPRPPGGPPRGDSPVTKGCPASGRAGGAAEKQAAVIVETIYALPDKKRRFGRRCHEKMTPVSHDVITMSHGMTSECRELMTPCCRQNYAYSPRIFTNGCLSPVAMTAAEETTTNVDEFNTSSSVANETAAETSGTVGDASGFLTCNSPCFRDKTAQNGQNQFSQRSVGPPVNDYVTSFVPNGGLSPADDYYNDKLMFCENNPLGDDGDKTAGLMTTFCSFSLNEDERKTDDYSRYGTIETEEEDNAVTSQNFVNVSDYCYRDVTMSQIA